MQKFQTQSTTDQKKLIGYVWDNKTPPRAVVALVHGFGEHSARYAPMAKALNANGIALITLDLRGHGYSDGKRGVVKNYHEFYGDIAALIAETDKHFKDIPRFIMGHSMGGALVINNQFDCLRDNIKAFIVTAPLFKLSDPPSNFLRPILGLLRRFAPNFTLGKKLPSRVISTLAAEAKAYEDDPLISGKLSAALALDMIDYGDRALSKASDWQWPLLMMHSRDDALTACAPSEEFCKSAQNARFMAFDNVGHEIHNDVTRDAVYSEIIQFISQHLKS